MAKKSNRKSWMKERRQERFEQVKFRYYIFCEGEQTEPNYFKGFKALIENNPVYRNMILVEIEPCGAETMRVINQAEEYVSKNRITRGQIWCVYDKDSFPAQHFNGVSERAASLNRKNPDLQYHAAWSNECIEIWFILHFALYTSNNHRSEYVRFLNERFSDAGLGKYQKNMKDIFTILMSDGKPKRAIANAKKLIAESDGKTPSDIAPGTKVYELVEELAAYLPDDVRDNFI